jgi:hypothetical protein
VREFSDAIGLYGEGILEGVPPGAILTRLRTTFTADVLTEDLVFVPRSHLPLQTTAQAPSTILQVFSTSGGKSPSATHDGYGASSISELG